MRWARRGAALTAAAALAGLAGTASAATIEPTVKADDITVNGNCTLREAVQAANENSAVDECPKGQGAKTDVILLRKGEYELSIAGDEHLNQSGDLDALSGGKLELRGKGIARTEVSSLPSDRVISTFGADRLKLFTLTLDGADGEQRGGVILADDEPTDPSLALDRVRVRDGEAQFGGGLGMISGKLRIKRSIFVDNVAEVASTGFPGVHAIGGGINLLFEVDARISDTEFLNNDAITNDSSAFGGALSTSHSSGGGEVVVRRSLFDGNDSYSSSANASSTRHGGAIYANQLSGDLRVVNSTFYRNRSLGIGAGSVGGAVFSNMGSVAIDHASFSENEAVAGSAVAVGMGSLALSRSALDGTNQGPLCDTSGGAFTSGGYNVATPAPFGCDLDGPEDIVADPLLASAPSDNGGATDTIKLKGASPAIDRVPKAKCGPAEGQDQRALKRPAGKGCDSGAFERGAQP